MIKEISLDSLKEKLDKQLELEKQIEQSYLESNRPKFRKYALNKITTFFLSKPNTNAHSIAFHLDHYDSFDMRFPIRSDIELTFKNVFIDFYESLKEEQQTIKWIPMFIYLKKEKIYILILINPKILNGGQINFSHTYDESIIDQIKLKSHELKEKYQISVKTNVVRNFIFWKSLNIIIE